MQIKKTIATCLIVSLFTGELLAQNDLYYKSMIRNRSRYQPERYNYAEIRSKDDLYRVKNEKFDPNRSSRVYNYVEIKNVKQNLYNSSVNNIGLKLNSNVKKRKVVNIVKIQNSELNSNGDIGVTLKQGRRHSSNMKIKNSVGVQKSELGDRTKRLMYKVGRAVGGDEW